MRLPLQAGSPGMSSGCHPGILGLRLHCLLAPTNSSGGNLTSPPVVHGNGKWCLHIPAHHLPLGEQLHPDYH